MVGFFEKDAGVDDDNDGCCSKCGRGVKLAVLKLLFN